MMTMFYFFYEKMIDFTFKKFKLKDDNDEDCQIMINYSKIVINLLISLTSFIIAIVIFLIFQKYLILSVIMTILTFNYSKSILKKLYKHIS